MLQFLWKGTVDGFCVGGWRYYANAVEGKVGAVLFAGCVAGVEGEGKDVETECCEEGVNATSYASPKPMASSNCS